MVGLIRKSSSKSR